MTATATDPGSPRARPLRPVRDLAGIVVRDASGVSIGSVWGALADARTGLIRYIDLSLKESDRHVLVPVGHARLKSRDVAADEADDADGGVVTTSIRTDDVASAYELRLRAALLEELTAIPPYTPSGEIDEEYENTLVRAHGELFHGERYYAHPAFDHRGFYAGAHPLARDHGVSVDSGLEPLRSLRGYRIAREEPDVRGWPLVGADGAGLGTVRDLIVEVDAEQVRYLAIQHDTRRVLLPIGFLEIDTDNARVLAPALRPDDMLALPTWTGGTVERPHEEEVRDALERVFHGPRRYEMPDFRVPAESDAADVVG
ncbi:MAG: PRC-barrel domain-containing protein [Longimicrobiales bacterium]